MIVETAVDASISKQYDKKIYSNLGNQEVINLVPAQAKSILDIGCGAGDNAKILKSKGKYVAGITISNSEAALVAAICDKVYIGDIEKDFFDIEEKFDVIILSHVCEHLINPDLALKNVTKYLHQNGVIIIAVPNMAFYKYRFRFLLGDWSMQDYGPFDRTHLHFYSYFTAGEMFDTVYFKLEEKVAGDLTVPLWPLRLWLPSFCKKIDKIIGNFFPNLFSQQVVLLISKK